MSTEKIVLLVVMTLITLHTLYRFKKLKRNLQEVNRMLIQGALIIDVRTPEEFQAAHHPSARNIPLDQISTRMSELNKDQPIVLCCASGGRSALALATLKSAGFTNVANAGAWTNLKA